MNKVVLCGRLTADPEVRSNTDVSVARFSLAVNRRKDEVDYFNCVSFGKTAEFADKYLKRGTKVILCGRLQNDSYNNKEGHKVTTTKVVAEEIEFAESKKEDKPAFEDKDPFVF